MNDSLGGISLHDVARTVKAITLRLDQPGLSFSEKRALRSLQRAGMGLLEKSFDARPEMERMGNVTVLRPRIAGRSLALPPNAPLRRAQGGHWG